MKREIEIMMFADHPNIIRLFETFEDRRYLHLVMELCTGGDICERLLSQGTYSESEASKIMNQLLSAVNYLHSNKVVHRDLKAENFLYESSNSSVIKICDFGMSIQTDSYSKLKSLAGTPYYLAPEVLKGNYTKACDVWSLGVFLFFLLTGKHPFKGDSLESIYGKASEGFYSVSNKDLQGLSENAQDLIKRMLTVQVNKRITVQSALKHKWLIQLNDNNEVPSQVFRSLAKYRAKSELMKQALKIVLKYMPSSQISNLRNAFLEIDSEHNGYITASSLQKAMKKNGYTAASDEIKTIMQNCSYIGEGKIKFSDFLVATINRKALLEAEAVWEAFKAFANPQTGKMHIAELRGALSSMGCESSEDEFKELLSSINIDSSSNLDYESFRSLLRCFEEESVSRESHSEKNTFIRKLSKDFKIQVIGSNLS